MRRVFTTSSLCVALALSIVGGMTTQRTTSADGGRSIPAIVTGGKYDEGEKSCAIPFRDGATLGVWTAHQIIIEDRDGAIVAKQDLRTFSGDVVHADSGGACTVTPSIAVPDSDFYRVYLDDTFITVIAASDLPLSVDLGNPDRRIPWVDFARSN